MKTRIYTIKIDRVINKKNEYFMVDIRNGYSGIGFMVKASKNYGASLRKVFRKIKEEMHI